MKSLDILTTSLHFYKKCMGTRTENLYFDTVPVKGKLTVSTRNSKLDPRSFRFLEARVSRLEFQVSSFELRVLSFELPASSFEFQSFESQVSRP